MAPALTGAERDPVRPVPAKEAQARLALREPGPEWASVPARASRFSAQPVPESALVRDEEWEPRSEPGQTSTAPRPAAIPARRELAPSLVSRAVAAREPASALRARPERVSTREPA